MTQEFLWSNTQDNMVFQKSTNPMILFVPLYRSILLQHINCLDTCLHFSLHWSEYPLFVSVISWISSLTNKWVLVSFDVVSLFTNVPTDLAVCVAKEKLKQDNTLHERTYLDLYNIISLWMLPTSSFNRMFTDRFKAQRWALQFRSQWLT